MEKSNDNAKSKMSRKGALGKGIGSLLGDVSQQSDDQAESKRLSGATVDNSKYQMVNELPIASIKLNPQQPRKVFDEKQLVELSESIKTDGVIQPVIVQRAKEGEYKLIAGERRLRASQLAGLSHIPAVVRNFADDEVLRVALVENIQRSDLNVIEEAQAYRQLIEKLGLTQEQCAKQVGKERSSVTNYLRLLSLSNKIKQDLIDGKISMGHARCLLTLESNLQEKAHQIIISKKLSVRAAEQLCKKIKKDGKIPDDTSKAESMDPNLTYVSDRIRSILKTKVRLVGNQSRGKIEVSYFNAAELERILEIIESNIRPKK